MELSFKKMGSGQPLVILHGLFGSSDNWQTLGRRFAEDYEVYLVDQRNHGHSPHRDVHNYEAMADDLYHFFRENHLYDAFLLGHSMGGKTAMSFVQRNPDLVEKLIVVDIGVKGYPMHHGTILEALNAVHPEQRKSRGEAAKIVAQFIEEEGVKQFLLKNLYWVEKGKLAWRFNLPVLEKEMPKIISALPSAEVSVPTLFIRGEKSGYILEEDYDRLLAQFPQGRIETVNNAGHWVHAEAPDTFYALVGEMLSA